MLIIFAKAAWHAAVAQSATYNVFDISVVPRQSLTNALSLAILERMCRALVLNRRNQSPDQSGLGNNILALFLKAPHTQHTTTEIAVEAPSNVGIGSVHRPSRKWHGNSS